MTARPMSARHRRTRVAVTVAVLLLASGCTSGGESTISSPTRSSAAADLTSSTPGPTDISQAPASTAAPRSAPTSGTSVGPGSPAAPAPVTHAPVGIVEVVSRQPKPLWTLRYSQLIPRGPKDDPGSTVDLALAAPGLPTYLVFASPPSGPDRRLFGVDAATGKIRWRYPQLMTTCSGPISGAAALCTGTGGSDLISIADGKRLVHFSPRTTLGSSGTTVVALTPGADYPVIGRTGTPSVPDVSSAASVLSSATVALSSVIAGGPPGSPAGRASPAATASSSGEPQRQDANATLAGYDGSGRRTWSATSRVAVTRYPGKGGVIMVAPPNLVVTTAFAVTASFQHGPAAVQTGDGTPAAVALPETFGGDTDAAGRIVATDDRTNTTTYWNQNGQQLLKRLGVPVEVDVFDRVPPLYFFRQKVSGNHGVVAVRPEGTTAWTSPDDLVDAYCNGVYVLQREQGGVLTAVDETGTKKWSATLAGAPREVKSVACAKEQVIATSESTDGGDTLTVLNAGNGHPLFTTTTVSLAFLNPSTGHLVVTGVIIPAEVNKTESVMMRY